MPWHALVDACAFARCHEVSAAVENAMTRLLGIAVIVTLIALALSFVARRLYSEYHESTRSGYLARRTPEKPPAPEKLGGAVSTVSSEQTPIPLPPEASDPDYVFTSLDVALQYPEHVRHLAIEEGPAEIPPDIGILANLITLDVRIPIRHCPPEIKNLRALEEISFYCTYLAHLPPELGMLPALRVLAFGGDVECGHPVRFAQRDVHDLFKLKKLEELHLNFLSDFVLPDEIGQLKGLRVLNLEYDDLLNLPESIGELENLSVLRLKHNRLKALPSTLLKLKNLRVLDIADNDFVEPPELVTRLPWLEVLVVSSEDESGLVLSDGQRAQLRKKLKHTRIE